MKKIYLILTILFAIGMTDMYGQCNTYDYELSKTGFGCDYSVGAFCFVANGNWTEPQSECSEYVVDIQYPTGSITITDIGDYEFYSEDDDYTTIRGEVILTSDGTDYVCFEGVVTIPGTQLKLFIVHPQTGDIVNPDGDIFYLDDQVDVGSDGTETLLSQAVADGLLLSASDAEENGQNVVIHGTLVIDEDYAFKSYSTMLMASGSSIRVLGGVTFNTTDTKLYTCDNEEWEGIDVEQGGKMEFIKSEIDNASIAIDLKNASECYVWGGKFYNNDVGIKVGGDSQSNLNIEGSPWGGQTEFEGGSIGIDYADLGTHKLNGWLSFSNLETAIQSLSFSLNLNDIIFTNCTNGVVSTFYSDEWPYDVTIKNCDFNSGQYPITVNGAFLCRIEYNTIAGGNTAIRRVSEMTDEVTYIKNNTISGVERGIEANVRQSVGYIQNNSIVSTLTAIAVNGLQGENKWYTQHNDLIETTASYLPFLTTVYYNNVIGGNVYKNSNIDAAFGGVVVDGGYFNQIGYNDVNLGYGGLPTSLSPYGVRLNSSDISNVYCNYTNGSGAGISILSDNSGSEIRENDMSATSRGLEYGNVIQTFANTGVQAYKGNHFGTSTPDMPKAFNYSPGFISEENKYILGTLAGAKGTDLFPYFEANYNYWFDRDNGGVDSHNCSSSTGGVNVTPVTVDKYKKVIDEDTAMVKKVKKHYGTGGVLHDVKVTTVRHILDYWELGGNMFQDVMQDQEYQEAIEIVTLQNQLNNVLTSAIYTEEEINTWANDMEGVNTAISQFETFTYNPETNSIEVHITDPGYIDLLNQLSNLKSVYTDALHSKQSGIDTEVNDLLLLCNALPRTGYVYGNYHKDILSLMMKYQLSDFSGFTQAEKNSINIVSEECGYIYGEAVYLARSLRATYDLDTPVYSDDCEDEKEEIELREGKYTTDLTVYPNPAKDVIVISNVDNTVFEIINSAGKLMSVVRVEGSKQINIGNYPQGVYFLIDRGGKLNPVKFTVIK